MQFEVAGSQSADSTVDVDDLSPQLTGELLLQAETKA